MNLSICFGIIPTWNIYELLKEKIRYKIYNFSKNTFIIYAAHLPTIKYFYRILLRFSFSEYASLVLFFLVPISVVLLLNIIGDIVDTYLPSFYKIISGSRNRNNNVPNIKVSLT
jgi:hypothetical protein